MRRTFPTIAFLIILFTACKKEVFPEIDNLTGSWIEQTDNSFKNKLIFDGDILYFVQSTYTDTLLVRLDKKQELMFLSLKNNPSSGESNHKIILNKKENTLTVWGLFASIPEDVSETVFNKE